MLAPEDLPRAAKICQQALQPALDRDWSVPAGDLEWDCRRTLDHIVDSLFFYAVYLASRATGRLHPPREGDPWAALRWAAGRASLPDRERLGPDWYWHVAPLAEWDGTIKKRTAPPAWRG